MFKKIILSIVATATLSTMAFGGEYLTKNEQAGIDYEKRMEKVRKANLDREHEGFERMVSRQVICDDSVEGGGSASGGGGGITHEGMH